MDDSSSSECEKVEQECSKCKKKLYTRSEYIIHLISHAKNKELCCKACGREVKSKAALSRHSTIHATECDICGKRMKNKKYLTKHKAENHRYVSKYICPYCNKKSNNKTSFEFHLQIEHPDELHFTCQYCNTKFSGRNIRRQHIIKIHPDKNPNSDDANENAQERNEQVEAYFSNQEGTASVPNLATDKAKSLNFRCCVCNAQFANEDDKNCHLITKHTKAFKCEKCSSSFYTLKHLSRHISVHSDKSIRCPLCNKKYYRYYLLSRHLAVSHRVSGKDMFTYAVCKEHCKNLTELVMHSQEHGEAILSCTMCDEIFATKDLLEKHEENHAVKWFICNMCNNLFKIIMLNRDYVILWAEKHNQFCTACSSEQNRKFMLENAMNIQAFSVSEEEAGVSIPNDQSVGCTINGQFIRRTADSHISFYKLSAHEENEIIMAEISDPQEDPLAVIRVESTINNHSSPYIISEIVDLSEEEVNDTKEILNSLRLEIPPDEFSELRNKEDVLCWLKNTIRSKEAVVKKEFIKFAQVIDQTFPDNHEFLIAARNYFCILDSSRQISLEKLKKKIWKFKCKYVAENNLTVNINLNVPSPKDYVTLVATEGNCEQELVLDVYPPHIRHIIEMFNQFFHALLVQTDRIPEIGNIKKEKSNFIEMYLRSNEKKDVMVVIVVYSSGTCIMDILRAWLQNIPPTYWNIKSLYYKSVCPKKNYSKTILLYGMNCIDDKISYVYTTISPKMLLESNFNEAELLGNALSEYLSSIKCTMLLHIGCGYGSATLLIAKNFNNVIGLDQTYYIKQARKLNLLNNKLNVTFIKDEIRNVEKIFENLGNSKRRIAAIINIDSSCGKSKIILKKLMGLSSLNYIALVTSFIEHSLPIVLKLLKSSKDNLNNPFVPIKSCIIDPTPADDNFIVMVLLKRRQIFGDKPVLRTEVIDVAGDESNEMEFSDMEKCISSDSSDENGSNDDNISDLKTDNKQDNALTTNLI